MDTNPSLSIWTQMALTAGDNLIVPVNADDFSTAAINNMFFSTEQKPEQMDGKRFTYISASSRLTVWEAVGPWLERTGACWLVQQAP